MKTKKSSLECQRKQALRCFRGLRDQNSSAEQTISSINLNSNGIVFTFRKGLSLNVDWCLNEVIMLARMAKLKVKKNKIRFWQKGHQLLLPCCVFDGFKSECVNKILKG